MRKVFFVFLLLFVVGCNTNINNKDNQIDIDQNNADNDIIKDYDDTLGVGINNNNFPDPEFIKYIKDNIDVDNDEYLSKKEIETVDTINSNRIKDLNGINYFTELETIYCSAERVTGEINLKKLSYIRLNNLKTDTLLIHGFQNYLTLDISEYKQDLNIYVDELYTNFRLIHTLISDTRNDIYVYYKDECVLFEKGYTSQDPRVLLYDEYDSDGIFRHMENSRMFFKGLGTNFLINKVFDNYEDALNYGITGNCWYRIDELSPTDEEKSGIECCDFCMDCYNHLIKYEVIVYDEQPF